MASSSCVIHGWSAPAYWRSWWNYPPVPDGLVETLNPDFIYLTHMHWDHFHGPTLRRLGLDRHMLIPRTPDRRIYEDLKAMGCTRITELVHGKPYQIGAKLSDYELSIRALPGLGFGDRGRRQNHPERQ